MFCFCVFKFKALNYATSKKKNNSEMQHDRKSELYLLKH